MKKQNTKFIFITGGVVSSLGKGIAAASLGLILKSRGFKVINQKFDPYLNIDPGNMDPLQHGEVFVTDDGAEADLDLGHYERFTDVNLSKMSTNTSGKIYMAILTREREGGYNGGTVQVIPTVTDEICSRIMANADNADVIITEIGGTVGDIESLPFIEACRQIRGHVGEENCCYIHLTLLPYLKKADELKSKPTQHSVKELQGLGIQPDIVMLRSDIPITSSLREKISLFCNVPSECIIQNRNADSIYEVPLMLEEEGLGRVVCETLGLEGEPDFTQWEKMLATFHNPAGEINIALVGKYVALKDAYLSVNEALIHGGIANNVAINISCIDCNDITNEDDARRLLDFAHGVVIPGGFGPEGTEGIIRAIEYARISKKPCLGICLGMQMIVIEHVRNVLGMKNAAAMELGEDTKDAITTLIKSRDPNLIGDKLRLGGFNCTLEENTKIFESYKEKQIFERHRHRYEINPAYLDKLQSSNLIVTAKNPDHNVIEAVEYTDHPWMIGVQFHPEFKSRPDKCHPLFRDFVAEAKKFSNAK